MGPLSHRKRVIYFIAFVLIFFVATPIVVLFASGYRYNFVDSLFVKKGGIYVYSAEPGTKIYLNNELKETTGIFNRELFTQNLKPGRYAIRAEHDDFLPWEKFIDVSEQKVTSLYPFLIPNPFKITPVPEFLEVATSSDATSTAKTGVKEKNPEYQNFVQIFDLASTTATTTLKKINYNNMTIWSEGEKLNAEWQARGGWMPSYFCTNGSCANPMTFLEVTSMVNNLDFYPGRDDVVIFSAGDGIYVAEVDKRPRQTVESVYIGDDVDFRLVSGKEIIIKDGEKIFKVEL